MQPVQRTRFMMTVIIDEEGDDLEPCTVRKKSRPSPGVEVIDLVSDDDDDDSDDDRPLNEIFASKNQQKNLPRNPPPAPAANITGPVAPRSLEEKPDSRESLLKIMREQRNGFLHESARESAIQRSRSYLYDGAISHARVSTKGCKANCWDVQICKQQHLLEHTLPFAIDFCGLD